MINIVAAIQKGSIIPFVVTMIMLLYGCHTRMPLSNPVYKNMFSIEDSLSATEGLNFLDSVRNTMFAKHPPGAENIIEYYQTRAAFLRSISSKKSLAVLDSLEGFLDEHKYVPQFNRYYIGMLSAKALTYTNGWQYEPALQLLVQAKELIDKSIDAPCMMGELKMPLADMLRQQGKYRLAASYFFDLHKTSQLCDSMSFDRFYYSYAGLNNAGHSYWQALMHDSASYCFETALELIGQNESIFPDQTSYLRLCRGVVSRHYGTLKTSLRQFEQAEQLIQSSIKATSKEYPDFARGGRLALADLYVRWKQLDKACELLDELAPAGYEPKGKYLFHYELYLAKKQYHEARGDYAAALYYGEISSGYADTLNRRTHQTATRDFATEFSMNEQERVAETLALQNEQSSFQLQLTLLLVVIAILVMFLVWSNLRRTFRHARNLEKLNEEVRRKHRDILDAYGALEISHRENTALMRTVAHDLKNPLSAIASLVRSLSRKIEIPEVKDALELIDHTCSKSLQLINNMVRSDTIRLQDNKKEINDIFRLLEYCVKLMETRAAQKKQRLILKGQSCMALINKDEIWRVMTNIIANAIKFSPEDEVIYITLEKVDDAVVLSVRDNGMGIPLLLQDKIFESSPEAQRTGTAGEPSHGMGLSISKKIIEDHKGKLWVESEEGEGSTFFVLLPLGKIEL